MSRLFEKIIDQVFGSNPHIYEEHLQRNLDADYQFYHHVRDEWVTGKRTPLTHSIAEWKWVGKPIALKSGLLTAK